MLQPIHTATIAGHPVRFFEPPTGEGFPWVVEEDLLRAVGYSENESAALTNRFEFGEDGRARFTRMPDGERRPVKHGVLRVSTADGLMTLCSDLEAVEAIGAARDRGHEPAGFIGSFEQEFVRAHCLAREDDD